jgi:hypothetical protein
VVGTRTHCERRLLAGSESDSHTHRGNGSEAHPWPWTRPSGLGSERERQRDREAQSRWRTEGYLDLDRCVVGRPLGRGGGAECLSLLHSAVRKRRRRKARWSLEFGPLLTARRLGLLIWVGRIGRRRGGAGAGRARRRGRGRRGRGWGGRS